MERTVDVTIQDAIAQKMGIEQYVLDRIKQGVDPTIDLLG
jgi:hypothetical protein